jgi:acetyltransferase-like isoleucine patch superfamily enzyme
MINKIYSLVIKSYLIFLGIKVGKNFYIESFPKLKVKGLAKNIFFGNDIKILGKIDIRNRENGKLIFKNNIKIEHGCRFVSAKNGTIFINDNTTVGAYAIWNGGGDIIVGKKCLISAGSRINANEHQYQKNSYICDQGFKCGNVTIGDDCLLGVNVVVTKDVNIKRGSVIGANSVVTKDTEEYSVNAGVPSKIIKYREE